MLHIVAPSPPLWISAHHLNWKGKRQILVCVSSEEVSLLRISTFECAQYLPDTQRRKLSQATIRHP